MKNKRKEFKIKDFERVAVVIRMIVIAIATGLLGFLGGWLFEGKIVLTLIVFGFLCFGCVVAWAISYIYSKRINILSMMDEDIKKKKYESVVEFGVSVSRALHLAGRNWERFMISEKVCDALKALPPGKEIQVNGQTEKVSLLRVKILLDDCGWAVYSINPFVYKEIAEGKIIGGISSCVEMAKNDKRIDTNKVYETTFIGLRHLFGMIIDNFDLEEKDRLINNEGKVKEYIKACELYGGLLGYLLEDEKMYDKNKKKDYQKLFFDICDGEDDDENSFFNNLKNWAEGNLKNNKKFAQTTYNFRAKYFYMLYKAKKILNPKEKDCKYMKNYLDNAENMAIKFVLGCASKEEDLDCIDIDKKILAEHEFTFPDTKRLSKAYLLLGKIVMISETVNKFSYAKTLFKKAAELSKGSRLGTYISAQKNIIAVNERILNNKLNNQRKSASNKADEVRIVLKEMNEIQEECKKVAPEDFVDAQMVESCKIRKKRYKNLINKYEKGDC